MHPGSLSSRARYTTEQWMRPTWQYGTSVIIALKVVNASINLAAACFILPQYNQRTIIKNTPQWPLLQGKKVASIMTCVENSYSI